MLHAGVLPHCFALTLPCLPTRCGVGAKVFARVGLHLLWACLLAGGWGLVFALLPVFVWVFACLLVCACLGLWGSVVPPPLCPGLFACLLAHALVWACWRVRGWRVRGGRVGGLVGAGQSCPAPYCVAWATSVAPWRGRERRGVWGAPGVLTRAHTQREEEGRERGATGRCRCWPGWGLWVVVAYHVGEQCPSEGEQN